MTRHDRRSLCCANRRSAFGPSLPFVGDCFVPRSVRRGRGHPAVAHAVAVCASLRLHCGARSEVAPPNSLRSLRSLRSNKRRRVSSRSALRAPTSNLALQAALGQEAQPFARHKRSPGPFVSVLTSSSPQKSPPPGAPCRSGSGGVVRPNTTDVAAKARPGRLRSASEAPSSAGRVARARSAHQQLTCRRLFERSERSERSEFGDGPRDRAAQGSLSAAKTAEAKRSSLPGRAFAAPTAAGERAANGRNRPRADTQIHTDVSCVAEGARRHGSLT